MLTSQFRHNGNLDLGGILTTLLNASAPTADNLLHEGTGVGRLRVFLTKQLQNSLLVTKILEIKRQFAVWKQ